MVRRVKEETAREQQERQKGWEWEQESAILLMDVAEAQPVREIWDIERKACTRVVRRLHRERGWL